MITVHVETGLNVTEEYNVVSFLQYNDKFLRNFADWINSVHNFLYIEQVKPYVT